MANLELPPQNPAELAAAVAQEAIPLAFSSADDIDTDGWQTLSQLETEAEALQFTDERYFVDTYRALSIPVAWDNDHEDGVRYIDFADRLFFEGDFRGYSKVVIGRIIGHDSVRAYCLTFENVTLLPYFDSPPEDHLFHVPALAVDNIDQTS